MTGWHPSPLRCPGRNRDRLQGGSSPGSARHCRNEQLIHAHSMRKDGITSHALSSFPAIDADSPSIHILPAESVRKVVGQR